MVLGKNTGSDRPECRSPGRPKKTRPAGVGGSQGIPFVTDEAPSVEEAVVQCHEVSLVILVKAGHAAGWWQDGGPGIV